MIFGQLAQLQVTTDRYQHQKYQPEMPKGAVSDPDRQVSVPFDTSILKDEGGCRYD